MPPRDPLPDNGELAAVFQTIADYLSLDGASVYRTLAYERAAETFREHPTSVAELALRGGLRSLPGVGEAVGGKVAEYLDTGTVAMLEQLRATYPEGVLDLMRLPGVGPKKAKHLFSALGIDDLHSLREAAEQGRIRGLPGMGAKTEANLLRALAAAESRSDRHLIGTVEPTAERLAAALRALPDVHKADFAGSLRRRRSTIRDIDLVAASSEPETVMDAFAKLPEVASVQERGPTKLVARTHSGFSVDLRVVLPEAYGNLLQHSTGSADHNVALRGYAQRSGYKVSEYGIEETATHHALTCRTEEEVYATLGLPWIAPELRENRGELEAAREDRLPRLVTLADLRGDLHVHSDWSDGRATMEEMARAAQAAGLEYVCFCDHSQSLGMGKGLTPSRVLDQINEIRATGAGVPGISLLAGSEVDILADGRIDLPDEVLAQLDFVTASIHSGFQEPVDQIMKRLTAACENPHIDAIGHPTGRLLGRRDAYPVDIDRLVALAVETNTILEINASYHRLDLSAPHARLARDRGALLMICSDAHSPRGYDALRFGIGEARRGWVEADDVVNTWPLDRLRASRPRPAG